MKKAAPLRIASLSSEALKDVAGGAVRSFGRYYCECGRFYTVQTPNGKCICGRYLFMVPL